MSGNELFGDWGRSPRGSDPDSRYAPTPVGVPCMKCEEPIRPGDVGEFMPFYGVGVMELLPVHRECLMLSVIGHTFGVCSCTEYAGTETTREAALELARRVDSSSAVEWIDRVNGRDVDDSGPPHDADAFT